MNIDLNPLSELKPVFGLIDHVIDHISPDKTKAAQAKAKVRESVLNGDFNLLLGQLKVDEVEAAHKSLFVAGWRPFVGWVLAFSLVYHNLIALPLGLPGGDIWFTVSLLGSMLGIHVSRSAEKIKGVAREK